MPPAAAARSSPMSFMGLTCLAPQLPGRSLFSKVWSESIVSGATAPWPAHFGSRNVRFGSNGIGKSSGTTSAGSLMAVFVLQLELHWHEPGAWWSWWDLEHNLSWFSMIFMFIGTNWNQTGSYSGKFASDFLRTGNLKIFLQISFVAGMLVIRETSTWSSNSAETFEGYPVSTRSA